MTGITTNQLAALGVALQYRTLVRNETGCELAATLLRSLVTTGTFNNISVVSLVGEFTGKLTHNQTEEVLGSFAYLSHDQKHDVMVPWFIMLSISLTLLLMRLISRRAFSGRLRSDDWLLIAAWFIGLGEVTQDIYQVYHVGIQSHVWDTILPEIRMHALLTLPEDVCYILSLAALKSSLLLFYYNLYPSRPVRRFIMVFGSFVWIYSIIACFMAVFKCRPIDVWDNPLVAKCSNMYAGLIALAVLNIFSDVTTLAVAMFIVYKLQMALRTKMLLCALFGLGAIVCAVSMYRLHVLKVYADSSDLTWASIPSAFWSTLELQLGIVCASIPPTRKLLLDIVGKIRLSMASRNSSQDESDGEKELTRRDTRSVSDDIGVVQQIDVVAKPAKVAKYSMAKHPTPF